MAFASVKFYSEALGIENEVYVIIPQKKTKGQIGIDGKVEDRKFKCLYLLHGLTDDHTIWMRRTSIERYATKYGICVVMPNGGRSFYTNMKFGGQRYYDYVARELPAFISEMFNVSDKREDNFIAGLSMGGYGALKIGMRECDRFCSAAALSAVANIRGISRFNETLKPIFGEEILIPDEDDLFFLAEMTEKNANKPRIYMTVGTEDFMYDDNVMLKEKFESLDLDYTYREAKGEHCWDFWDVEIQGVLKWMFE